MEFVNNKLWRLAPTHGVAPEAIIGVPVLASPEGFVAKLSPRHGIVVASWDPETHKGHVHALGIVQEVDKTRCTANVNWLPVDFTVIPSPQGRSKWRDLPFFKFDDAVAERYRLMGRFSERFALTRHVASDAQPSPISVSPDPRKQTQRDLIASNLERRQRFGDRGPQRNRIAPNGEIFETSARGTFMGNRADRLRWLVCELEFERELKEPRKYTKLFFLDEAVAFSAGHRPCRTCRRDQYRAYLTAVRATKAVTGAHQLDAWLNAARQAPSTRSPVRSLPDGAFISFGPGDYRLVWQGTLYQWSAEGYREQTTFNDLNTEKANVLTPAPSLAALRHGYRVEVHASVAQSSATSGLPSHDPIISSQ